MTWSILARDGHGRLGVAIASRFFAVGALCAHTRRGVGALATQALLNPLYGPAGIERLAQGCTPAQVVAELTEADPGRAQRQVHVLGANGSAAAHTGEACVDWCGHFAGEGFSVAGNMLAGPQVLRATVDAFVAAAALPLAERLIEALAAGEAAGGDKRGKQSAALRIHGDEDRAELDLRVDDHAEPIAELRRLHAVSLQRFQPFVACLAGRHDPVGELDRARIEARIEAFHASRAA
ncbi:MAG TPA: DUF1028 domain-containing protein [Burkholderiaceae bacterium]|nr:DUF1028 domain-containing protein [Burkholderiaceae bacterium]